MTTPQDIVNELVLQTVTGTVTWETSSPFWVSKHDGATFFVNHGDGTLTYAAGPGSSVNRLADASKNRPLYDLLAERHPTQDLTDEEARRDAMDHLAETATLPPPAFMLPNTDEWERSDVVLRLIELAQPPEETGNID